MFDITEDLELATDKDRKLRAEKRLALMGSKSTKKRKYCGKSKPRCARKDTLFADSESETEENTDSDVADSYNLGMVSNSILDPSDKCVVLNNSSNGQNYSKRPRFCDEDIEVNQAVRIIAGDDNKLYLSKENFDA